MKGSLRILIGILLTLASTAHAALLTLNPAVQSAQPGDVVSVDLRISGLGAGTDPYVGAFDIDIGYDSSALSLQNALNPYTLGTGLGDASLGELLDFSGGDLGGVINVRVASLLENDAVSCVFCVAPFLEDLQGDSFVLATFDFFVDTLAPGTSTALTIVNVFGVSDGFGTPLAVSTENALVSRPRVGEVATPAPIPLVALGILLMAWRKRVNFGKQLHTGS